MLGYYVCFLHSYDIGLESAQMLYATYKGPNQTVLVEENHITCSEPTISIQFYAILCIIREFLGDQ